MDDLISRQDTIDRINEYIEEYSEIDSDGNHSEKWCAMQEAKMTIENMPSAQPEKRTEKRTKTHACDLIDREAAIEIVDRYNKSHMILKGKPMLGAASIVIELEALPSAQPGQRNARVFQGIIVEYPSISAYPEYDGKPYFSIKYTENGQEFIGYGTYKPEVLSEYLKEYFMPPTQPGWIPTSVRLPEDNEEVLFCDNEGERWLGWHYGFWKTERLDFDEDEVVAWMPLPTPYREGGQDD